MKKLYSVLLAACFSLGATATTINVTIVDNAFTPNAFTANIGDVVVWTWTGANAHNVTSASVPAGAATFSSPTQTSGTFSYTITTSGSYGYMCTIHAGSGMVAGFSVTSPTGIVEPVVNFASTAYPNPFAGNVTIKYNNIQKIEVLNVLGEKVKSFEVDPNDNKAEIDFEGMPSGVYFYRTYNEGVLMETKKIVKSK